MLRNSGITVLSFANKVVKVQQQKFVCSLYGVPKTLQYVWELPNMMQRVTAAVHFGPLGAFVVPYRCVYWKVVCSGRIGPMMADVVHLSVLSTHIKEAGVGIGCVVVAICIHNGLILHRKAELLLRQPQPNHNQQTTYLAHHGKCVHSSIPSW